MENSDRTPEVNELPDSLIQQEFATLKGEF